MRARHLCNVGMRCVLTALCVLAAPSHAAAPRAEIQVALCGDGQTIERALDLVPRGPVYATWLFDDPALSLMSRGVRLRLRMQERHPELTLKVAEQDCRALPKHLVPRAEGKCEYDVHGAVTAGAVSLSQRLTPASAAALTAGAQSPADALSAAQRRYLRDVVHVDPLPADLRALGPIASRVMRTRDGRYDVDATTLPDGATSVEISVKVPVTEIAAAQAALTDRLAAARVTPCADQAGQAAAKLRTLLQRTAR